MKDQTNDALARSERQRAEIERIAQVGSWEWDVESNRITWSDELFRIFGLDPRRFDPTYEAYVARLHPDDRELVASNVRRAMESGVTFSHIHRVVRVDGTERVVQGRGEVVRNADGAPVRLLGTAQDITERIALERETAARLAAEAGRERAEFLADVGVILATATVDYEETLRKVAALAVPRTADWCTVDLVEPGGALRRVAIHHTNQDLLRLVAELGERYPDDPSSPYGAYEVVRTGVAQRGEVDDTLIDGAAVDAEHARLIRALGLRSYIVAPLLGRDGVIGAISFVNDTPRPGLVAADLHVAEEIGRRAGLAIDNARLYREVREGREQMEQQAIELEAQTSQLQEMAAETEAANEELRVTADELLQQKREVEAALREAERARHDAEAANRAKAEFLATMSHELRTPINAALGYSELLAMGVRGPVTQAQSDDLARIQRSQHVLLSLVNDILDFARLEAGRIEFRVTDVRLGSFLAGLEPMVAPQMHAKALRYSQKGCGDDVVVRADAEKLQQVLLNLLTNAVKFTDRGGEIELACVPSDAWVELRVRDTGRGIAADQLSRVFEPFVQLDRHLTQSSQQGVGLGLAISRDLIHGMAGDIVVVSEPGKGSTFVARLPRGIQASHS